MPAPFCLLKAHNHKTDSRHPLIIKQKNTRRKFYSKKGCEKDFCFFGAHPPSRRPTGVPLFASLCNKCGCSKTSSRTYCTTACAAPNVRARFAGNFSRKKPPGGRAKRVYPFSRLTGSAKKLFIATLEKFFRIRSDTQRG